MIELLGISMACAAIGVFLYFAMCIIGFVMVVEEENLDIFTSIVLWVSGLGFVVFPIYAIYVLVAKPKKT